MLELETKIQSRLRTVLQKLLIWRWICRSSLLEKNLRIQERFFWWINRLLPCLNLKACEKGGQIVVTDEFPTKKIVWILKQKARFVGILYAMSRHDYWATEDSDLFPLSSLGSRFDIGIHRFNDILVCLPLILDSWATNEKWRNVGPSRKRTEVVSQDSKVIVDESMFDWYWKGNFERKMLAS